MFFSFLFIIFTFNIIIISEIRPHTNVVQFLGICFSPLCVVVELLDGSVESLIDNIDVDLDEVQVISMALDAARGVLHLHTANILHCDLACRNLLYSVRGLDYNVKVSDFGLSRVLGDNQSYYAKDDIKFPVKWSSPEVIRARRFSIKSDGNFLNSLFFLFNARKLIFF